MGRKWNWIWIVALAMTAGITHTMSAQSSKAEVAFRTAFETETVKGDLKKAIEQYKKLASDKNPDFATRALLRLAGCYRKLGNAEERKVYERILRDFPKQQEAVAIARRQLGQPPSPAGKMAYVVGKQGDGGFVDGDSVSPDGRYISFESSGAGDPGNLAVRDLTTGTDRQLTHETNVNIENGYASLFSPDGRQIAYTWADYHDEHNRGELRIMSIGDDAAKSARVVVSGDEIEHVGPVSWSPDGKWIAIRILRHGGEELAVVSVSDKTRRVLTTIDGTAGAVFSPDSRYVAVSLRTGAAPERDVVLYSLDGGAPLPLVTSPEDNHVMGWASDGRLLYTRKAASVSLWAVPVIDGRIQGTAINVHGDVGDSSLGLTSRGALYYRKITGGNELFLAAIDLAAEKVLTPRTAPLVAPAVTPAWSPDGRYLAFFRNDRELMIRSNETGQTRMLRIRGNNPLWSPDGRSLVLVSRRSDRRTEVVRVDAETGVETPVTHSDRADELIDMAMWAGDGGRLYLRKRVSGSASYTLLVEHDIASGQEREMLRRNAIGPTVLSPDGRYLAVSLNGGAMLLPVDGSAPRELIRGDAGERIAVSMWSPDSRAVYVRRTTAASTMTRIPLDGSAARTVDFNMDMAQVSGPIAVHPGGRQIAYVVNQGARVRELSVLENFLPALSK